MQIRNGDKNLRVLKQLIGGIRENKPGTARNQNFLEITKRQKIKVSQIKPISSRNNKDTNKQISTPKAF